ncbi:SRPBCC family protein [Actinokineospora xionganensis]|uniref:SRPBCC domain-containing protein n=1 Tax=Actinokineospora xionganensis TaxID=2684470 RepID=A0ABR7L0N4_9PSEU|nr:SRPBCC domain-containing protein [Actinokineospora xionganensis]MBC6446043.1 SRPBCC domain-containing protein [Actinokineospora xionganensis]
MADMSFSVRVPAPLDRVRHALTDPAELTTWLAEHAEVDLPHNTYAFWGRYTPAGDKPRQRLLHADDTTLRFTWTIDDAETTTEVTLEPENDHTTVLTLSQSGMPTWEEMTTDTTPRSALQTFWALAVANLVDHLDNRPLTAQCDFTTTDMRARFDIAADPADVFDALVDPEKFSDWFGAKCEMEPYVGGRFAMGGFDVEDNPGTIVAFDPGRKLAIDLGPAGVSTWELDGSDGKTRITFVQSGFDHPPYDAWMGWLSGFAELRRYFEIKDWKNIWLSFTMPGMPEGIITIGS